MKEQLNRAEREETKTIGGIGLTSGMGGFTREPRRHGGPGFGGGITMADFEHMARGGRHF